MSPALTPCRNKLMFVESQYSDTKISSKGNKYSIDEKQVESTEEVEQVTSSESIACCAKRRHQRCGNGHTRDDVPPVARTKSHDTSTATPAMAEPPNSDPAAAFLPAMPHIAGTFYDFDEWTDALMNALGACIYISESLTCDGTYTVYSHEYEGEDTYLTETTEDGFIVQ